MEGWGSIPDRDSDFYIFHRAQTGTEAFSQAVKRPERESVHFHLLPSFTSTSTSL
jgi:hypothetical protein